ncbi:hypothetical protein AGLY_001430 [Aphis glycines]|uniref:Tc1-like transposase DDE domain-containing protein n=1 Tax=Aphis glycines TaxID=307491 RepID=A0A6G0U550_APHGL|nr:hypothetical protein AGLY_001430 [Aphis glycines]
MCDRVDMVSELDNVEKTMSPKKRNIPGKMIWSRQKIMIINIYKDMKLKSPSKPYKEMMVEISNITGIGRNSIVSIISEYKKTGTVTSPNKTRNKKCLFDSIDDLDRNALRQKVHSFWLRKEIPTIDKILHAVNEDPALPDFKRTSLYSLIKKLDFVFTKRKRCSVLTEREDLLVWRQNYLYDVRKYREEGRTVYYLDETWLNTGDCVDKVSVDQSIRSKHDAFNKGLTTGVTNPTGKGKRLIIVHIGSHKGFVDGGLLFFESKKNSADYHDEMNGDSFHEWFKSILPRLDPNSVIVMDNAPYHSVRTEKIPTSSTKKEDIISWLISKNVVIDQKMFKPQLLAKVKEIKGQYMSYVVDNMAKDAGHNILRLPPYHCELNPIELAWAMVKGYVKQHNTTYKIDDVKLLLNTAIERVTSENWQNFLQHVKTEEDKMTEVDENMDAIIDNLEPCVLTITGDTSNSDDDL